MPSIILTVFEILGFFPSCCRGGQVEFAGEEPDAGLYATVISLPENLSDFLLADLDTLLAGLSDIQLNMVKDYQSAELKKLAKTAIMEALAEHLYNDGEVDLPSETWAIAKAAALDSVQTSLSVGLVAEVEQIAAVKK